MKLGIGLAHHDHVYVERRGGWELLTHLRGGGVRADYRRRAADRSLKRFEEAREAGAPDAEVGGHGLLVLQRALLAAEDLGGLLHAFADPDPWSALRRTRIPTLDKAFARAAEDPRVVLEEAFRLTNEDHLLDEGHTDEQLVALGRLRSRTYSCWARMLHRVAELWANTAPIAKATMHGFPVLAGSLVLGPPSAGQLAETVEQSLGGLDPVRFAVAIPTELNGNHFHTTVVPVALSDAAVAHYHGGGITAARLYARLCEAQASSIMGGYGAMLSGDLMYTLPEEDRAVLEPLLSSASTEVN
jgi:hypothetical protein